MKSERRTVRLALGISASLWFATAGCGERVPAPPFGHAPEHSPLLLVDRGLVDAPPVIRGTPTEAPSESATLARWRGDEVDAWKREQVGDAVRFTSPPIGHSGLSNAGTLFVRLRPGGATRVVVVPSASGTQLDREHRVLREVDLALERDAAPDHPVDLEVDLYEALHGNLGDAGRSGNLEKLEITLPGARQAEAALLSVSIRGRHQLGADAKAGSIIADHDGVLRPAWFVHGGVTVSFALTVPEGTPELRWHDAALRGAGDRVVEVRSGDETVELFRTPAVNGERGAPWRARALPLARFAGQKLELSLRTEGAGTGLFGEPRIVDAKPAAATCEGTDERTPDVLVYMIDTLRADRLGVAGGPAPGVSPTIDRLAESGVWFDLAQSSSPWTKPAIATLMSGILPIAHRVGASSYTDRMPAGVPLVQERFRAAGWRTGSFSASPLGSTLSALERGFSVAYPPRFWGARAELAMNPSAAQLSDALLAWVDEQPEEPFFAYVHTLEVHEWKLARYQSGLPAGYTSYDAAILDADRQLGLLLAALDARQRDRDLLVVVVSDHGESWGDHGLPSHGFGLFQSQIHIPLIFWRSSGNLEPRRIAVPVSLADLAPTLLAGLGLPALDEAWGRSLVGYFEGQPPEGRPVLSSLIRFVWAPHAPVQHAVTTPERVKLIRREPRTGGSLDSAFDLLADPAEVEPLAGDVAKARASLAELLAGQEQAARDFRTRYGERTPGAVTGDDAERLRALGYLETGPGETGPGETESSSMRR